MAPEFHLPLPHKCLQEAEEAFCMENDEITQGERQEIAQWDRMFSKGKEGGEREVGAERTELNLSQDRAFWFFFFLSFF